MSGAANDGKRGHPAELLAWIARQPRRNLLLVALLPVLVLLWLPIVGGTAAPARLAAPTPAGAPPAAPLAETAPGSLTLASIAATASFEDRVRELTKPFRPRWAPVAPVSLAPAPRPEPTPAPYSALVPTAILLSRGGEPLAIVQGRARRVGDVIAGHTIVAIEERRVVYRGSGRTFTAEMASTSIGARR